MTATDRSLTERLDEVRRTPLGDITDEQAGAIVEHVLPHGRPVETTVDVARFGSSV